MIEEKKLDKDINVRSKTELSDDEIIKDIERSTGMPSYWKKIVLDLIHRLQSENAELKAKRKKILANRVYSDATLKSWRKEDLIEQIRILEHNWAAAEESLNNSAKNSEKIFYEQKAEIERLTEENKAIRINCENARNITGQMFDKNDELQKQVDELKKSQVTHIHIDEQFKKECEYELRQAVKDTAKDILQYQKEKVALHVNEAGNWVNALDEDYIDELANSYGVEVE